MQILIQFTLTVKHENENYLSPVFIHPDTIPMLILKFNVTNSLSVYVWLF